MKIDDKSRLRLLSGPYLPPRVRRGDSLFCKIRGHVKVGGYTNGIIPWPRLLKSGRPTLILCGDLIRAVQKESEIAISHHWGVSVTTIWKWRKTLGVGRVNDGTLRLYKEYKPQKLTEKRTQRGRAAAKLPLAIEKRRRKLTGKDVHPNVKRGLLRAARRRKKKLHRRHLSDTHRRLLLEKIKGRTDPNLEHFIQELIHYRKFHPRLRAKEPWHHLEIRLVGLAPDRIVAQIIGRSTAAVFQKRTSLGLPAFLRRKGLINTE